MARRTEIKLIDDLDGTAAAETIRFAYAGTEYDIDLSRANAAKMRKAVEPYATAGRRIVGGRLRTRSHVPVQRGPAGVDPAQTRAIREWLRARGVDVPARGRIPARLVEAFHAGELPSDVVTLAAVQLPPDASSADGAAEAAAPDGASTIDEATPGEAVSAAPKRARKTAAARKSTPRKAAKADAE